jgi:hypothetical protein
VTRSFHGYKIFDFVTLTLVFDILIETLTFSGYIGTRALTFPMSVLCDKTFPWVPKIVTLVFDLHIKNFKLGYNFWIISTRALIFHLSIPYHRTFPWVPEKLTSWPWRLTYWNFNLGYNFWVLSIRYLILYVSIRC